MKFLHRALILAVAVVVALPSFADHSDDVRSLITALNEVQQRSDASIEGSFAVMLKESQCESLRADSDLGPFIASAGKHHDDALVLVIPSNPKQAATRVVFFRDNTPTAFSYRSIDAEDALESIESHRSDVKSPAPKKTDVFDLEQVELTADDGTKVNAVRIKTISKRD
jgi:hypothetical protein